jgi:hypothetical protein
LTDTYSVNFFFSITVWWLDLPPYRFLILDRPRVPSILLPVRSLPILGTTFCRISCRPHASKENSLHSSHAFPHSPAISWGSPIPKSFVCRTMLSPWPISTVRAPWTTPMSARRNGPSYSMVPPSTLPLRLTEPQRISPSKLAVYLALFKLSISSFCINYAP